ncbi:MAG: 2Fe-2S iron-sulfur cluster binding protein [Mucilaginibacter sp.]|nr:2Fe-2S iron-sulfur cluster binding protein [Mucilaginibacter sp.]
MENPTRNLTFALIFHNERQIIQVYQNEYYSLMTHICDRLAIPGFGLCCGMGSLRTCIVDLCDKYTKNKTSVLVMRYHDQ